MKTNKKRATKFSARCNVWHTDIYIYSEFFFLSLFFPVRLYFVIYIFCFTVAVCLRLCQLFYSSGYLSFVLQFCVAQFSFDFRFIEINTRIYYTHDVWPFVCAVTAGYSTLFAMYDICCCCCSIFLFFVFYFFSLVIKLLLAVSFLMWPIVMPAFSPIHPIIFQQQCFRRHRWCCCCSCFFFSRQSLDSFRLLIVSLCFFNSVFSWLFRCNAFHVMWLVMWCDARFVAKSISNKFSAPVCAFFDACFCFCKANGF